MNRASKVLYLGGWLLALLGMSYGLWYAVFDEHQTLEHMGLTLAKSFTKAAEGNLSGADAALAEYSKTQAEYVREVHAHSHWIVLAMVMVVLGLAFDRVALADKVRQWLAWLMLLGSILFPAGVLLQNFGLGSLADVMAMAGAGAVILSLAGIALGLMKAKMGSG